MMYVPCSPIPPPLLYSLPFRVSQPSSRDSTRAQDGWVGSMEEASGATAILTHLLVSTSMGSSPLISQLLYFEGYGDFLRLSQWKATPMPLWPVEY